GERASEREELGRCPESRETHLDLVGALARGKILQVFAINRDRRVLFSSLLLSATEIEQQILVVEVGRREASQRRLVALGRLGGISLGFPGVTDAGAGQRPERRRPSARRRNLVGGPGSPPVTLCVPR